MLASKHGAVREWAYNVGHNRVVSEWLLSDYDTWEHNPHYIGPASGQHPEMCGYDDPPHFYVFLTFSEAAIAAKHIAAYSGTSVRVEHYNNCCWVVWV